MKTVNRLIACFMVLLWINGCNNDNPVSDDIVAPQFQPQQTNVGYLVGSVVHLRNSALLAEAHINQNGGVLGQPFNLIILQSENPEVSAQKSQDLMDNYNVPLIMVTTSSRAMAVAEQAIPREVVVLSETATSPLISTVDDNDFLFRTAPSDVHQGRMLADLAWQHGARSAVMLINQDDTYGIGLSGEFNALFVATGGEPLKVVQIPEEITADFGEYINQVYQGSPDTVILSMLGGAVNAQFVNESVGAGFDGFYLLPDTAVGTDFSQNLASTALIGEAIGVSPSFGVDSNPEFVHFKEHYFAQYNIAHQQFDPNVYDAVMVAALAMEHAGFTHNTDSPNGTMIRDSMREIMNPPGEVIGPSQIGRAIDLVRSGQAIDYTGAYSNVDFDNHGDLVGTLVYDIYHYDPQTGQLAVQQQLFVEVK